MAQATCAECGKPTSLSLRGKPLKYCSKACANRRHAIAWRKVHRVRQAEYFDRECIVCSASFRSSRPTGKFCSDSCKGEHYRRSGFGRTRVKSPLPIDHPVMVLIAEAKAARKAAAKEAADERRRQRERSRMEWRTARECPGCACMFTPLHTPIMITCSKRCARRVARWRRAASERGAFGEFTWSEFMRIARKFHYCCAYCGEKPSRLDPDHVVPLSRGGSNTPSNLLPTCMRCNSDKQALLLHEWAAHRTEKGKPPRVTTWTVGDPRYSHLSDALLVAA